MKSYESLNLNTPALLLDLEVMEQNIQTMSKFLSNSQVKLRPHFKNHRVLALATRQIEAGAIGITCARLWEAERLLRHGIRNILIANEIASSMMIKQLVEFSSEAPIIVAVDNSKIVRELAYESRRCKTEVNIVIDVDLGLNRCGVQSSAAAVSLAKLAVKEGLRLRGLMGYEGHLLPHSPSPEKELAVKTTIGRLVNLRTQIEKVGLQVDIVTCGGTGDASIVSCLSGVTEIQAGSYLLMDTWYSPFAPDFRPALSILTTIISKTPGDHIVADAGVKALSTERGLPSIKSLPSLHVRVLHGDHAVIETQCADMGIDVGDRIEIFVHYHDGTINLYDRMYGIRKGKVQDIFKIEH